MRIFSAKKMLIICIAIISCNKNSGSENQGNGGSNGTNIIPKVKTKSSSTQTTTYTYDVNGRLSNSIATNGNKEVLTYNAGDILANKSNTNPGGYAPFLVTYTLNAAGLTSKITDSSIPASSSTYQYNSDKTISHWDYRDGINVQLSSYFYTNGNLDSIRGTDENGNWTYTSSYTYYTDKTEVLNNDNYGKSFLGKGNKNMTKSQHIKYPGVLVYHYDYEYTYDSNGRVSIQKTTDINGVASIQSFTYY